MNRSALINPQTDVPTTAASHEAEQVLEGLLGTPKRLPCQLLYDELGSRLFEEICDTPEYYPARTERVILEAYAREITRSVGPGSTLVEWGSGASVKTRIVLDALAKPSIYVPIDISREILMRATREMRRDYPDLDVRPLVADYLLPLELPLSDAERARPIVTFFPGSTLGNFEPGAATEFLASVRRAGGKRQHFILGTDLPKPARLLEAAYDDAAGVTARFNKNILNVVNVRFEGNFDPSTFIHRAVYDTDERRVEMHLVSCKRQEVTVLGRKIGFEHGEPIVTEHCYKYSFPELEAMASRAGFAVADTWTDPERRFAVHLWRPA